MTASALVKTCACSGTSSEIRCFLSHGRTTGPLRTLSLIASARQVVEQ